MLLAHFRSAHGSHINKTACNLIFAENAGIARGPTRFGARTAIFLTPIYFRSMIIDMNQPRTIIFLANFSHTNLFVLMHILVCESYVLSMY